ncbi:MAG: sensor histidine kinase [Tepidiformaceae bacterium]
MMRLLLRGAVVGAAAASIGLALGWAVAGDGRAAGALAVAAAVAAGAMAGAAALLRPAQSVRSVSAAAEGAAAGQLGQRAAARGGAPSLERSYNRMAGHVEALFDSMSAEHARLEAALEAAADAMLAIAPDNTVRFMNGSAVRLLEMTREAALGRPFIESARDYELDALVRRALVAGTAESSVITYGRARTPLRAVAVPISGGGEWAVLLVLNDLTEVQRTDQVRRDFLGNVSHELRTPLAAIRALVETIESGAVEDEAERAEFVARIAKQVERLTALVNELLDLSRIEAGAIELRPEQVSLADIVAEAVALLAARLEREEIRVEGPAADGSPVEADRGSLLRVVSNLLDNAIKYSPRGGKIRVETKDEGELVALVVSDEGPGISPQDLWRVFERFYKGDASRASTGVGLGLAIVKHLVRAHGGTVAAASPPGEGASFTVRLPKRFVGGRR